MEEPKIKIGFSFTNEFGCEYTASSCLEVFESLGERTIDVLGEQFNTFLSQIGYIRSNSCMFMEDVSEEEVEKLSDYLHSLRDNNSKVSDR